MSLAKCDEIHRQMLLSMKLLGCMSLAEGGDSHQVFREC